MANWREELKRLRVQAGKLPNLVWAGGGVLLVAAGVAGWLEMSGPPYSVLDEGLSPSDGGKVIAQLQKLGIPYQLQADGDVILVPAPQLSQARLQLGVAQVPGTDATSAWTQVENAPMTASDLAQTTMASQALELSLEQSIEQMQGIKSAQVFLAIPPETPFLADQPKPSASVVITADAGTAQAQGAAIANMVAGAVPGLNVSQVSVETTAGIAVYPQTGAVTTAAQLATQTDVENEAVARVSDLLTSLVGPGNFQTGVSANIDFTQEHTHEVTYGPGHIIQHEDTSSSDQSGSQAQALGIPGAMSNEPPTATSANPAPVPSQTSQNQNGQSGQGQQGTQNGSQTPAPQQPHQSSKKQDQTYVTDESDSDIVKPDWTVKSLAISVVLNKAVMGNVTPEQVKAVVAGAFSYPSVKVNVLSAPFKHMAAPPPMGFLGDTQQQLTRSILEILAGAFVLFGLALPVSRKLAAVNLQEILLPPPPPPVVERLPVRPVRDLTPLRDSVHENPEGVARMLQHWVEEEEG